MSYKNLLPLRVSAVGLWVIALTLSSAALGQQQEEEVIRGTEQAQWAKETRLSAYSVTEQYRVLRSEETKPAATLTVRTVYTRDKGKDYSGIISRDGSSALQKLLLDRILKREEEISRKDNRKHVLITSDNYVMKLSGEETIKGRKCWVLKLTPRTKSPHLLDGQAWVDSQTYALLRIQGRPSARPSFWAGRPLITRDYNDEIHGFPLAIHAEAESNSLIFGTTKVIIDYKDYDVTLP